MNDSDKAKDPSQEVNLTECTDEVLIARFQADDFTAFDEIVHRYQGQLINFVGRLLGDRITAEDIVQETFLRVYRNKHRYKEIARFSTWIYTIAGNLARTELRRRKIRNFFSISQRSETERDYEIPDTSIDFSGSYYIARPAGSVLRGNQPDLECASGNGEIPG